VGLILATNAAMECQLFLGDRYIETANETVQFIHEGSGKNGVATSFLMPSEGSSEEMLAIFEQADVVLDCLPGSQAPRIARLAKDLKLHYANLTEYVNETNEVAEIAKDADTAFVLQTGLAPGFINVLACRIFEEFIEQFNVNNADRLEMKVGALSKHAKSPHYYAFTWSPIGVATEYLKDAYIVRNNKKITVSALSGRQRIIIDGDIYEDNFTSGGAADLPEVFPGKVNDLDYKTLRYPGHYEWVETALSTIPRDEDKIKWLERIMLDSIASVEDDEVVIYSSVTGKDSAGRLRRKEKSYKITPSVVGTKKLRAIQTTTASPLCEIARMMISGRWKGPIYQSQIDTLEFLKGPYVSAIYGKYEE
jgi:saccharopine dehydrogenase-like NADP-dependent oxidoreductase